MPFDTSNVAATVGQGQQTNPIDTIQKFAFIQNLMNQNRLFQGQTAAGNAMAGSLNSDGSINQATFANSLQGIDPRYGAAIPAAAQQGVALATDAQTLAGRRFAAMQAQVGPLMTAPSVTNSDVEGTLSMLKTNGVIPESLANDIAGHLPSDPTQLRPYLANRLGLPGLGPAGALNVTAPPPVITNLGNRQAPLTPPAQLTSQVLSGPPGPGGVPIVQPNTGGISVGPGVATTLSPAEAATRVPTVINGVPSSVSVGAISTPTGAPKQVAGLSGPSGEIVSGFSPTATAAGAAEGAGSANQLIAQRQDSQAATGRILALRKALAGVQAAQTGPGSDALNQSKSFLQMIAPNIAKSLGIDPSKVQSFDEANKYLTQYASGAASALGPSTDAKLATAISGNASTHISNLAAQDVIRVTMGIERMKQAQIAAWDAAGEPGGAANYSKWASTWARGVDPRGFILDVLPKADRTKMLGSITTAADKRALLAAKAAAEQAGQFSEGDIPR